MHWDHEPPRLEDENEDEDDSTKFPTQFATKFWKTVATASPFYCITAR